MSQTHRFVLVLVIVLLAFFAAMTLWAREQHGYTVVDLNGTRCIVFDSRPNNGGETTELDRLRCPSGTPVP